MLSIALAAALSPALAAAGDATASRKHGNKLVGTLCPALADVSKKAGDRAKVVRGKHSFSSPAMSYCFLRIAHSTWSAEVNRSSNTAIALEPIRRNMLERFEEFFAAQCLQARGRFVWAPEYLAKNGRMSQFRGCVTGNTYRFVYSVERAPVEGWPVFFVRIAEPTDFVGAPDPDFAEFLRTLVIPTPGELTSVDWARVSDAERQAELGLLRRVEY